MYISSSVSTCCLKYIFFIWQLRFFSTTVKIQIFFGFHVSLFYCQLFSCRIIKFPIFLFVLCSHFYFDVCVKRLCDKKHEIHVSLKQMRELQKVQSIYVTLMNIVNTLKFIMHKQDTTTSKNKKFS